MSNVPEHALCRDDLTTEITFPSSILLPTLAYVYSSQNTRHGNFHLYHLPPTSSLAIA